MSRRPGEGHAHLMPRLWREPLECSRAGPGHRRGDHRPARAPAKEKPQQLIEVTGVSIPEMVAGIGFEPMTFRL